MADAHVVVVEDTPEISTLSRLLLDRAGVRVTEISSVADARAYHAWHTVDVVVLDHRLGDGTSVEVAQHIAVMGFRGLVVVSTGLPLDRIPNSVLQVADAVLSKRSTLWMGLLQAISETAGR